MAEIKVVELQIKTNIDGATTGINNLKTGLKEATTESKALGETMSGSKQSDFINQLSDGVGKLNPAFGSAVKGAEGLIVKMWEMVANPVGAILAAVVVTLKFLYESFQSSVAGGKELKATFVALSGTVEAGKDAIFGLGRALINVAVAAVKFLQLDFKGANKAWAEAGREAAQSQEKLGNIIEGTTTSTLKALAIRQAANDKARKIQEVDDAKGKERLVNAREIVNQEGISTAQKLNALKEIGEFESKQASNREKFSKEDLAIFNAKRVAFGINSEQSKKMAQEGRDLEIAATNDATESTMQRVRLDKSLRAVKRQGIAEDKAAAATKAENDKKARAQDLLDLEESLKKEGLTFAQRRELIKNDTLLDAKERQKLNFTIDQEEKKSIEEHQKKVKELNDKFNNDKLNALADTAVKKEQLDYDRKIAEINAITSTESEKNALLEKLNEEHNIKMGIARDADTKKIIDSYIKDADEAQKNADAKIKIAKAESDAKLSLLNSVSQGLSLASNELGESTDAGKIAAVAAASISTYTAIAGQLAAFSSVPIPGYAIAQAIVTGISGLAQVKKILSVKTPKGGSGGSNPSIGGLNSSATSAVPQFNVVGASSTNQLAQSIGQQQGQPIKAYVVASDVTTQQGLTRNIVNTATLGT